MEFCRFTENQIDAEADGDSFGVQGVFEQGLDLGRLEEFLECVATGDDAIAVCLNIIVGFLSGDQGGDQQGSAGMLPGIEQCLNAFGGIFDDIEDEAEIHHIGVYFWCVRCVNRIPAGGSVTEFGDCFHITAVAAAIVEERFTTAQLTEFQKGFYGLGNLSSNKGSLVTVDLLLRRARGWRGGLTGCRQLMAFEAKSFFGESSFPIQPEANAGGVVQQAGIFFLSGQFGEFCIQRMTGRQESFLAVKDGRIGSLAIVVASDLAGDEIDEHRLMECRVGMLFEVRIGQE